MASSFGIQSLEVFMLKKQLVKFESQETPSDFALTQLNV